MSSFITGIIVVIGLIVGFGMKLYFGEVVGEKAESTIEKVVEATIGVDLEPIFDLDNEEKK